MLVDRLVPDGEGILLDDWGALLSLCGVQKSAELVDSAKVIFSLLFVGFSCSKTVT